MNTNNLYEMVKQSENKINYEELYTKNGKNDRKSNPEQLFNTRFNEGINILRQPLQSQPSALDKNQIFNNDNNYDATKNYYSRYQNNFINQSLMNCEEASGVGNFATFKSDPNSNNYINSLTKQQPFQPHPQQQIQRQPQQPIQRQPQQQIQRQPQQPIQRQPQQQIQRQAQQPIQQQPQQQKCDYCLSQIQNRR
jgi:hypothetical protein